MHHDSRDFLLVPDSDRQSFPVAQPLERNIPACPKTDWPFTELRPHVLDRASDFGMIRDGPNAIPDRSSGIPCRTGTSLGKKNILFA